MCAKKNENLAKRLKIRHLKAEMRNMGRVLDKIGMFFFLRLFEHWEIGTGSKPRFESRNCYKCYRWNEGRYQWHCSINRSVQPWLALAMSWSLFETCRTKIKSIYTQTWSQFKASIRSTCSSPPFQCSKFEKHSRLMHYIVADRSSEKIILKMHEKSN